MIPYYQEDNITIYHGSCETILPELDIKADLVIADPPYLFDKNGGGGAFGTIKQQFRRDIDAQELGIGFDLPLIFGLIKDKLNKINQYVFCNKKLLREILNYAYDNELNFNILMYHKSNPVPVCNNNYMTDTEFCIFMRDVGVPIYGDYYTKKSYWVLDIQKRSHDHPTIKPLSIIETLVINSSNKSELILDPYMGTGTTLVAAKNLGRKAIGIERELKYCKIAVERLRQSVLFV